MSLRTPTSALVRKTTHVEVEVEVKEQVEEEKKKK